MNNNLHYFMIVADELSISKAAKKVFISPQAMSQSIQRLEKSYDAQLFQRKPEFKLTAEGKILLKHVKKIQTLHIFLEQEMSSINDNSVGTIRIGMHSTRQRCLMPSIYTHFHKKYPDVHLLVKNGSVAETEELVINGDLDFFVGPYPFDSPELESIVLQEEDIYLVISDKLLKKHFSNNYSQYKNEFKKGININNFKEVPFLMTNYSSNMSFQINNFLKQADFSPNIVFETNSNDVIFQLASLGHGACFCPEMMFGLLNYSNRNEMPSNSDLNIFPIIELNNANRIVIAYHKDSYQPNYTKYCIRLIKNIVSNKLY